MRVHYWLRYDSQSFAFFLDSRQGHEKRVVSDGRDGISNDHLAYWISTFRNANQFEEAGWDFVADLNIPQAEAVEIANSVIVCFPMWQCHVAIYEEMVSERDLEQLAGQGKDPEST